MLFMEVLPLGFPPGLGAVSWYTEL